MKDRKKKFAPHIFAFESNSTKTVEIFFLTVFFPLRAPLGADESIKYGHEGPKNFDHS